MLVQGKRQCFGCRVLGWAGPAASPFAPPRARRPPGAQTRRRSALAVRAGPALPLGLGAAMGYSSGVSARRKQVHRVAGHHQQQSAMWSRRHPPPHTHTPSSHQQTAPAAGRSPGWCRSGVQSLAACAGACRRRLCARCAPPAGGGEEVGGEGCSTQRRTTTRADHTRAHTHRERMRTHARTHARTPSQRLTPACKPAPTCWMSASVPRSTLAVASSSASTAESCSRARASANSWRCPTDRLSPASWRAQG